MRWTSRWMDRYGVTVWKLVLAITALLDIIRNVLPALRQTFPAIPTIDSEHCLPPSSGTSSTWIPPPSNNDTCPILTSTPTSWWGPFVIIVCLGEAIRQALHARQVALEAQALDQFEQKLVHLYQTTRCSVFRKQPSTEDYDQLEYDLARSTLRSWTPVGLVLAGWLLLMPLSWDRDASVVNLWIQQLLVYAQVAWRWFQKHVSKYLWHWMLPYSYYRQPVKLWHRVRLLSRWLRYLKFAGPLLRMLLKLMDQLKVVSKTWRHRVRERWRWKNNEKRINEQWGKAKPIQSLVPNALVAVKSKLMSLAQKSSEDLRKLLLVTKRANNGNAGRLRDSQVFHRVVDLTKEVRQTLDTAGTANLISPQTRFSVTWRLVVTAALISELGRLALSYRQTKSFRLRYPQLTLRLLTECHQGRFHRLVNKILQKPCMPTSMVGRTSLWIASMSEMAIAAVCFVDIFVWFFTGELDQSGEIVAKPFLARYIAPGMLVQVLDHPTVPAFLPHLIGQAIHLIQDFGYGRVIRWWLLLSPAWDLVVVHPLRSYFFRPLENDEFLRYTQSLALVPTFSRANFQPQMKRSHQSGRLDYQSTSETTMTTTMTRRESSFLWGGAEDSFGYGLYY